jgi:hypothetical protein
MASSPENQIHETGNPQEKLQAQNGFTESQKRALVAICEGFIPRLGAEETAAIVAKDQAFCKRQFRLLGQDGEVVVLELK